MFRVFIVYCLLLVSCQSTSKEGASHYEKERSREVFKNHRIDGVSISRFIDQRSAYLISGQNVIGIHFDHSGNLSISFKDNQMSEFRTGSAAAITADGYFLTAYHVLDEKSSDNTWLIHRRNPARLNMNTRVVWVSEELDLAIIKAELRTEYFKFGDPERNKYFRIITAGLNGGDSSGAIVDIKDLPSDGGFKVTHSAPIRRGDSGGALISLSGELLGINSQYTYGITGYGLKMNRGVSTYPKPEMIFEIIDRDRETPRH